MGIFLALRKPRTAAPRKHVSLQNGISAHVLYCYTGQPVFGPHTMKFLLHIALIALLALASPAGWALLDNFLEEHPYRIRMGNKKLAGDLKEKLDEQRKG